MQVPLDQLILKDFSIFNQLKSLLSLVDKQPLVVKNQDLDQIWTQLTPKLDRIIKNTTKQINKIKRNADVVAEKMVEEDTQVDKVDDSNENDIEEELNDQEEIQQLDDEEQDQYIEEGDVQDDEEEQYEQVEEQQYNKKSKKDNFAEFEQYLQDVEDGKIGGGEEDEDEDEGDENQDENEQDDYNDDQNQQNEESEQNQGEDSVFDDMREDQMEQAEEFDEEIQQLENKIVAQKDWQMKGEVNSKQRPINSLLEQDLDFNINRAKIQEAVEQVTSKIEDLIKQRVKDDLFDDRQKVQISLNDFGSSKKQDVDTNKSQFGLAEIYERQFKQVLGLPTNTTEQKLKQEVYSLIRELNYKLDSLSNLNFEPRGFVKQAEIKLLEDNVISKEEKVPITRATVDDIPEKQKKVVQKRGFISKEEASHTDNIRSHRAVKQRLRNKLRDQRKAGIIKKLQTKGETKFMYNQHQKGQKQLQELNSKIKNRESVKFDKSSKFFKNLQETQVNKKIVKEKKK
ncbi:hypothetical protein pb186bvf_015937 [Paramecium bursaria]